MSFDQQAQVGQSSSAAAGPTSAGAPGKSTLVESSYGASAAEDQKQGEGEGEDSDTRAPAGHVTNGGNFVFTKYVEFDGDPGKDTRKSCGIDITITFTPNKTVKSDQISFVQIMKADRGGTPLLFDNEKPRATDAKDGEEGWAVDRLAGNKNADYQIGNDGKEVPGWGQVGHRKSDTDVRDATLEDGVRLPRSAGQTFKVQATSFALDKTNSKYLGGVAWGYDVDAKGKVTKTAPSIQSMGDPGGIQKRALERWNEQAKNPDKTKRNHDDQQPITVP